MGDFTTTAVQKNERKTEMKYKFTAIATAVLLALSIAPSFSATSTTTGSTCPRFSGTLTIVSSIIIEKPDGPVEQEIANAFMKQCPKIEVEFIGVGANDVYTKLSAMAIGHNMPDIFVNSGQFGPKAYSLGLPDDLTKLLGAAYIKGFQKELLGEATFNGKITFAPVFSVPTAILYRTDLFKAAGVTPPKTYTEFLDVCKKLTKDTNGDGKIDQYGWAMVGTDNWSGQSRFNLFVRNMGGTDITKNAAGNYVATQNSNGWQDALQLYADAVKAKCVPPGQFQSGYPEASMQVATGQAAMMITGPHSIGVILANNPAVKGKLAGAPLPTAPGVTPITSLNQTGYSISRASTHKAAAVAYLKFFFSKKWQLRFNDVTYRIPSRLDAQEDPQVNSEMSQGFVNAGMGAILTDPQIPYYASIAALSSKAYQAAMQGDVTIAQIAKEAQAKAQQIIKDNN